MPLLSVVMPVYNGEMFIQDTLDSLLYQTFRDFELICVDDGSTDSSVEILQSNAAEDKRIVVIRLEHLGAANARNVGLNQVRGKYTAILDSDDIYMPTFLEKVYSLVEDSDADIVVVRSSQFCEESGSSLPIPWSVKSEMFPNKATFSPKEIKGNPFLSVIGWTWDKVYRTDFLKEKEVKFQNIPVFNDLAFGFSTWISARKISFIDEIMVNHRIRPGSISSGRTSQYCFIVNALAELKNNLESMNLYKDYETAFINYSFHMLVFAHQKCSRGGARLSLANCLSLFFKENKNIIYSDHSHRQRVEIIYAAFVSKSVDVKTMFIFFYVFFFLFRKLLMLVSRDGIKQTFAYFSQKLKDIL